MAINIKNLEERIQKKAYAVTSNTPTSELGDIVEAALLATNSLREYDSADLLPTATSSNEKLAYIKKDNSIRFNNGTKWDSLVSGAAQAGAVPPSAYFGYVAGGYGAPDGNTNTSNIEKFNMTSDANGVSTGDLIFSVRIAAGGRSSTHGYSMHGLASDAPASHVNPPGTRTNTIQKWPFAADGDATEVGDMLWYGTSGHSNPASSSTHSYGFGGYSEAAAGRLNTIQKWSHSTDGNATDVGDLLVVYDYGQALYSADYGYTLGGLQYTTPGAPPTTQLNQISKFPFASDGNAADVGDLTTVTYQSNAFQSSTAGYKYGGGAGPSSGGDTIESFPFASDADATDTADNATSATDLTRTGHNTDTAGYLVGGRETLPSAPSPKYIESEIDKYLFAGGADMTNVADLSTGRSYHSGVNQN